MKSVIARIYPFHRHLLLLTKGKRLSRRVLLSYSCTREITKYERSVRVGGHAEGFSLKCIHIT